MQSGTGYVLHHDVWNTVVLAELEGVRAVRGVELRQRSRLVQEHLDVARILDAIRVEHLDHDVLLEPAHPVERAQIGERHPARSDAPHDPISAELVLREQSPPLPTCDSTRGKPERGA